MAARAEMRMAMGEKYSEDELAKRAKSSGWGLMSDTGEPHVTGTLEDVAKAAHARAQSGKAPGVIREIETAVELEMIQLEKLWMQLGLPI
jgi:hypothetical protein